MKILIIRFSALGDISLVVPVIREIVSQDPAIKIDILTNPKLKGLFNDIPQCRVLEDNVFKEYNSLVRMWKLSRKLIRENYDAVVDLHDSLRTKILKLFFSFTSLKVHTYDKGRKEKTKLLAKVYKNTEPLMLTSERYLKAFKNILSVQTVTQWSFVKHGIVLNPVKLDQFNEKLKNVCNPHHTLIGIAPFSRHQVKEWPLDKVKSLIEKLLLDNNKQIFLFGNGSREMTLMQELQKMNEHRIHLSANYFTFDEELCLMSRLSTMISMDSANMHLAELSGCPNVISIWGPTHSNLGFAPLFHRDKFFVLVNPIDLPCRPCSIYGNKPCHRGDHACMERINTDDVLKKVITQ